MGFILGCFPGYFEKLIKSRYPDLKSNNLKINAIIEILQEMLTPLDYLRLPIEYGKAFRTPEELAKIQADKEVKRKLKLQESSKESFQDLVLKMT